MHACHSEILFWRFGVEKAVGKGKRGFRSLDCNIPREKDP